MLFVKSLSPFWRTKRTRIARGEDMITASASMKKTITLKEAMPVRQSRLPSHRTSAPIKSSMKWKGSVTTTTLLVPPPSITLTSVQNSPHVGIHQPILDFCNTLNGPDDSCRGFLSLEEDDCRYFVYNISSQTRDSFNSITLNEIICGTVSPKLTRRQRYAISLVLSSSFLQLSNTEWLSSCFQKGTISFFSDSSKPNIFLLDKPHIACDFSAHSSPKSTGATVIQSLLDQLGILLLELCYGRPLEDQPERKAWPQGSSLQEKHVFDLMAARDWQCGVNEEAGTAYAEAVAWCLGGNRSTPLEVWRQEMLRRVVQPLQKCQEFFESTPVF